jgi:hypothetical protein
MRGRDALATAGEDAGATVSEAAARLTREDNVVFSRIKVCALHGWYAGEGARATHTFACDY